MSGKPNIYISLLRSIFLEFPGVILRLSPALAVLCLLPGTWSASFYWNANKAQGIIKTTGHMWATAQHLVHTIKKALFCTHMYVGCLTNIKVCIKLQPSFHLPDFFLSFSFLSFTGSFFFIFSFHLPALFSFSLIPFIYLIFFLSFSFLSFTWSFSLPSFTWSGKWKKEKISAKWKLEKDQVDGRKKKERKKSR